MLAPGGRKERGLESHNIGPLRVHNSTSRLAERCTSAVLHVERSKPLSPVAHQNARLGTPPVYQPSYLRMNNHPQNLIDYSLCQGKSIFSISLKSIKLTSFYNQGRSQKFILDGYNFYCTIIQSYILAAWRHRLQLVHKIIFRERDWFWGYIYRYTPRRYAPVYNLVTLRV